MSERSRRRRISPLDPTSWPAGTGIVLFIAWLAYAVVTTVWVNVLLWTVLPLGLSVYLFAERYPWRVILVLALPLTLLTACSQAVGFWLDAPTWVAFAIYLVASAYFSFVVCYPSRDRWIARLPRRLLGAPFAANLAWGRFEESVVAANAMVRQINSGEDRDSRRSGIHRLATAAQRESRRGGPWQEAWGAHARWLDGLGELVEGEPTADALRHVNDLLAESNRAQMLAIEQTADVDPGGR